MRRIHFLARQPLSKPPRLLAAALAPAAVLALKDVGGPVRDPVERGGLEVSAHVGFDPAVLGRVLGPQVGYEVDGGPNVVIVFEVVVEARGLSNQP